MNIEMHGKQISEIYFEHEAIKAKDQTTLMLSATYHGDRDEFWVIQYLDMQEVARHNCKYIATIKWA